MSRARLIVRPLTHRTPRSRTAPLRRADEGMDWAASGWAGLVAGTAFILIETAFVSLFNGNPNADAMRQIAALALGESVLPPPTPFTGLVFLAATGIHLILSLFYARLLAMITHGLSAPRAVPVGAVFGAFLYLINYYAFTGLFPWFEVARGWITLFAHVSFGAIAAWVYAALTEPKRSPESPIPF